ncbi:MAG TPA: ABC transporter ATP-binding protein [Chthonomonadales bacterium]|nr:ABC transporter ATP-binding protein [Chthonomonadales bacterium]
MILRAEEASLSYFDGDRTTYALRDLSITLPSTGLFGIMGPSGSGKSSLLYVLSGLKTPTTGDVRYDGRSLRRMPDRARVQLRRQRFGFVFQQPYLLGFLTARENILIASPEQDRRAQRHVDDLMEELQIARLRDRFPAHLSGGERQRIIVARSMINHPEVIFADEPTASLDHSNGRAVVDLLERYRSRGAVIVVTHDAAMLQNADTVYYLQDGSLAIGVDLQQKLPAI